jgi:hypothetical protein
MTQNIVEPLNEQKRWRTRDVKYWGGTWEAIAPLIPTFEIGDFKAEGDSPSNPYMKTVIRKPQSRVERPMPVGVVSNSYGLAQHHEVAAKCFDGIRSANISPKGLRCEVGLTELGEWMNLRVYFPDDRDFKPAKGDSLKLRLECFNSVDGSSRLIVLLGWMRLVCTNGMVIRETKTELTDIHDDRLDLEQIPKAVSEGLKKVRGDEDRMKKWVGTKLSLEQLAPWANQAVSESWGKKAACRVFHICRSGHDVELEDAFAPGEATEKPVKQTVRVPGSPALAENLFDVSQAMSWVATGRNNPDERLDWQSGIPRLVGRLSEMAGSR